MPTYDEVSRAQLLALSHAVGQSAAAENYIGLQKSLFSPWATRTIPETAPYASQIGDDHSPYEYSVAYGAKGAELRLLFEPQAHVPSLGTNHAEALRVNGRLARDWGVCLSRYNQVADLFSITRAGATQGFSLWHAACLSPSGAHDFKVYLNPQLHGPEAAGEVVEAMFARLGLSEARSALSRLRFRGSEQDELRYVSLDLSDQPRARVKVYTCHHQAKPAELERAFAVASSHRAADVSEFCGTMAPGVTSFDAKSVSSCLAFVAGNPAPYTATLHLPIAHYAETDAVARRRIDAFMQANQMDQLVHARVLRAIAKRPLHETSGVQSYASYRRDNGTMRLTAYLSPELFRRSRSGVKSGSSTRQGRPVGVRQSAAPASFAHLGGAPETGHTGS
jgi:DMATS type aromatic prenyltransferase